MKRRAFIAFSGAAASFLQHLPATAQQASPMRRVGVLMNLAVDDPESKRRILVFGQGLQQLGWSEGRNLKTDVRWGGGDRDRARSYAAELLSTAPDVILAAGAYAVVPLLEMTKSVPIVFIQVIDPVAAGFVRSLARPGGNATGFTQFEFGLSVKWLELLKQTAPRTTRVGVVRDPLVPYGIGQFAAIQSVAPSLGMEVVPIGVSDATGGAGDAAEIEQSFIRFRRGPNDGLIVTVSSAATINRQQIVTLAAQLRLPAVYPFRYFAAAGGLISYGPDLVDQYRQAAGYIDRILRGEKPADLPVQNPVKYETVLNLGTAKALGLNLPVSVHVRADEVIE